MTTLTSLSPDEAQRLFRVYLDAMSRPGSVHRTNASHAPAAALPLLTLVDLMSPVAALDTRVQSATHELLADVARVTGAPLAQPEQARFALALSEPTARSLEKVSTATANDPHTACVVIQGVEKLGPDAGATLILSGPGVDGQRYLGVLGLSSEYFAIRNRMCAHFPAGIDLLLVTEDGDVAAIPRSTTVEGSPR